MQSLDPPPPEPSDRTTAMWFFALAATSWVQIAFGALVRGKKAGLACPDWPLCHGALVPSLKLTGVVYEYGHRLFALVVSALFVVCAIRVYRAQELRQRLRRRVIALGSILSLQIVVGGLTVLIVHRGDGDPRPAAWTVVTHLILGNLFAAIAVVTGLTVSAPTSPAAPNARTPALLWLWSISLALQFLLGGAIAGTIAGLVCTEFPTCYGGLWFPSFQGAVGWQIVHRLNAYLLVATAIAAAVAWKGQPQLRRIAMVLVVLVVAQAIVGAVNIFSYLHTAVTTAHSLLAALLFSTTAAAWHWACQANQP